MEKYLERYAATTAQLEQLQRHIAMDLTFPPEGVSTEIIQQVVVTVDKFDIISESLHEQYMAVNKLLLGAKIPPFPALDRLLAEFRSSTATQIQVQESIYAMVRRISSQGSLAINEEPIRGSDNG
ncbi:hypothetical protein OG896_24475 [Streptomyces sp. NBC_00669]|uniref:hypothetical protein n=1 Tax=Streptomyces sp. NBC_00669 TaxID=2976011 RepID=UPI002E2F6096|nr:hypothetical protein [Streptomyces sp. NBC_00669]